tara:strand:+ start:37 stop:252 length:216 start_codon:yes stop_codon:yes gene_type:complete
MAIEAYKGKNVIRQTLKKGFSVCRRYLRGDTPNDKDDCFLFLSHHKTESAASKSLKTLGEGCEIIEFKAND